MRIAKSLPLLQPGQHIKLLRLLVENSLSQKILFVGLQMLQICEVVLFDSPLNRKHLRQLPLVRQSGLVRLTHGFIFVILIIINYCIAYSN